MVAILGFSRADLLAAVKDMYTAVATEPARAFHFPVGRVACRAVGYPDQVLDGLSEAAIGSFAGVGYPFRARVIRAGDTVLDIGSGSGTDAFIASRLVGPTGKVYALDMTPAMVAKLRRLIAETGTDNIEVIEGNARARATRRCECRCRYQQRHVESGPRQTPRNRGNFPRAAPGWPRADCGHRYRTAGDAGLRCRS
jgi:protein-L-isoaspartate O-methyltransferase